MAEISTVIEGLLVTLRTTPHSDNIQPDAKAAGRHVIEISHAILRREWQRVQHGA